jgi:hypothetical protein
VIAATPSGELRLHIGKRFTGIAVVPDDRWAGMWRVRNGEHLSDMVNLARAKDAAVYWARPRGLGGEEKVRWDHRETPVRGAVSEFSPAPVHSPIPLSKTPTAEVAA